MNVKPIPWSKTTNGSGAHPDAQPFPLLRGVDTLFEDFLFGSPLAAQAGDSFYPAIEVHERDEAFVVTAELPGLCERDLEVTWKNGVLTLAGERKSESSRARHSERWSGRFQRQISLGDEVDAERISAALKDGVLTVTVPKKTEAQRGIKRIAVR